MPFLTPERFTTALANLGFNETGKNPGRISGRLNLNFSCRSYIFLHPIILSSIKKNQNSVLGFFSLTFGVFNEFQTIGANSCSFSFIFDLTANDSS